MVLTPNAPRTVDGFTLEEMNARVERTRIGVALAGAIFSGIRLRKHKRERERLKEANYGRPPRVQWNPAQSRFVF